MHWKILWKAGALVGKSRRQGQVRVGVKPCGDSASCDLPGENVALAMLLTGALLCVATVVRAGPGMPGIIYNPAPSVQNPAPPAMQEAGMTCDRCQATWVMREDSNSKRKLTTIRHAKVAACPHCKMAAA